MKCTARTYGIAPAPHWRVRTWALALLCACSDSPCELVEIADCATCGPGELRHAFRAPSDSHLFVSGGRLGHAACGTVADLDDDGDVVRRHDLELPPKAQLMGAAGNSVSDRYLGYRVLPDARRGGIPYYLVALDEDFQQRWQLEYATGFQNPDSSSGTRPGPFFVKLKADREGAYLVGNAYAATDGQVRFTYSTDLYSDGFEPDGSGGMFLTGRSTGTTAVITAVDASNATRWTKTFTTTGEVSSGTPFELAASPDGSLVVMGRFRGTELDLGEAQLVGGATTWTTFVALLDASGSTAWAHVVDGVELHSPTYFDIGRRSVQLANLGGGVAVLAASGTGGSWLPPDDERLGFIAVLDQSGVIRAHSFRRASSASTKMTWGALALTADGSLWATVSPGFRLGEQTAPDAAAAVNEADAVYIINLLP